MPHAFGCQPPDPASSGDQDADVLQAIVFLLHQERLKKGLTLRDLKQKMGISHAHLSRAERGVAQPGLVVILRWCRALDLKFGDIWKQVSGEQ